MVQNDISKISDIQAEAGVVATLMYHPEFILHTDYLKAGYFYDRFNGCIYWAVTELYKSGVDRIDVMNIENMLNSNSAVKRTVASYHMNIQEFIDMAKYASRDTIEEYKLLVNTVVVYAFKRDLVKETNQIQSSCFNDDIDLATLQQMLNNKVNGLLEKYLTTEDIRTLGDKIDEIWDTIQSSRNADGTSGIPTRYPLLNEYFTYEPGQLILFKAMMKRGKSAFMMNEAIHKLKNGMSVLYIDSEMSDEQVAPRILAHLTGIPVKAIRNGSYGSRDEAKINDAIKWIKSVPFVHEYMPNHTENDIFVLNKILQYKIGMNFSVYDYIKPPDGVGGAAEISNYMGSKIDFLKNKVAGELQIPVLCGCQLNEDMKVADSRKLERYCDTSVLWRDKTKEEIANDGGLDAGNFCLRVDVNRNGGMHAPDEYINFQFNGNVMQIEQAAIQGFKELPFD